MAYVLVPVWITPANHLLSVVETDEVSLQLLAHEEVSIEAEAGDLVFDLTEGADRVISVQVNGVEVVFSVDSNSIVLLSALTEDATVVARTDAMHFKFLNGSLPPGLTLSESGLISGRAENLSELVPRIHRFTVRIQNETYVRDRTFSMDITGFFYAGFLNPRTMRGGILEPTLDIIYHPLATLRRGTPFKLTLDVLDQDGVTPPIATEMILDLPETDGLFGWLPPGLFLVGTEIIGRVDAGAEAGAYYFTVNVVDPEEETSVTFRIVVLNDVDTTVAPNTEIYWTTAAGSLGTLKEAHRSLLSVQAEVIGGDAAVYSLTPGSGPLPPGLTLRPTGDIAGIVGPLVANTVYYFSVRATSGLAFVERSFSIYATTFFNAVPFYDMKLRMNVMDRLNFMRPYKQSIPASMVFRSDDVLVGVPNVPEAYLMKGLDARVSLGVLRSGRDENATGSDAYFQPVELIMGQHLIAVERDSAGKVLMEVIFRPLFDPERFAGGFQFLPEVAEAKPVISPISGLTQYPISLRNQRLEMVNRIGFATTDAAKKHLMGPRSLEILPGWMRSEQVLGDPTSVIGFVPAVVVANIKPGKVTEALKLILAHPYVPPHGRVYTFDRYYVSGGIKDHAQL